MKPGGELEKSNFKRKKILLFLLIIVVICIICVYSYGVYFYSTHFFRNTVIDGSNVSNMTLQEAADIFEALDDGYELTIIGRENGNALIVGSTIAFERHYEQQLTEIMNSQNSPLWFVAYIKAEAITRDYTCSYDKDCLQSQLAEFDMFKKSLMRKPVDAYISEFNETTDQFDIVQEDLGTYLDWDKAMDSLDNAICNDLEVLNLEEAQCYIEPNVYSDDDRLLERQQLLNSTMKARVTYDFGENKEYVSPNIYKDWFLVDITEKKSANQDNTEILDKAKVKEYLTELSKQYDTYNQDELFNTVDGYVLQLPHGSSYGWHIDIKAETKALMEDIVSGNVVEREPTYLSKGECRGDNDYGDFYMEVDISNQHVYVVDKGNIVFDTKCVTGNMSNGNFTPAGIFGVTYKTTNATLRGPGYASFVKYWMPFNGGIGFHDASWRKKFGGKIYKKNGSHGCVNLPTESAKTIYDYVYTNCPVIVYYLDDRYIIEYPEGYEEENEATTPEVAKPEVAKPEATSPEVAKPEATTPEATEPEATTPEATEPEAHKPEN